MQGVLDVPESLLVVQQVVEAGLRRVEKRFDEQLASDLPPVSRLCRHVERYRGKMLRPTLVLLAGLASHAEGARALAAGADAACALLTDEHIALGAVCEMVHMATLVHDDVLDEAEVRRRGQTVNAMTDNETAVILGDYLIASAYHLCSTVQSREASVTIGDASMRMCAGELLQLHHRGDFSLDRATYDEILRRKTAALLGVSCALGANASRAAEPVVSALRRFGETAGIAFQIQDDLLDLTGDEGVVGKSVRKDLEKGKLTLPLIHALEATEPVQRGRLLRLIESVSRRRATPAEAEEIAGEVVQRLRAAGSMQYARSEASRLIDQAKAELALVAPSPARELLAFAGEALVNRRF